MFDILFDVSQYENLIFKPFKNHFAVNNNSACILQCNPLNWKYILPDEYNDLICFDGISILHVN